MQIAPVQAQTLLKCVFTSAMERPMNNIIYIVGLVVIVIAVLSWLGLR